MIDHSAGPCDSECPHYINKITRTGIRQVTFRCNRPSGHEGPHRHSDNNALTLAWWHNFDDPNPKG